jgi:hypothetical protein
MSRTHSQPGDRGIAFATTSAAATNMNLVSGAEGHLMRRLFGAMLLIASEHDQLGRAESPPPPSTGREEGR